MWFDNAGRKLNNTLFWIVGSVSQKSWIEPASYPIAAFYHDTVFVGFHKFVIEENLPLSMHYLTTAMSHKGFTGCFAPYIWSGEVLECVGQL